MSSQYDQDPKEPKVVVYKDYERKGVWIWEVYNIDEKKCHEGTAMSFNEAYEEAKATRAKHNRKLRRSKESNG